MSAVREGLLAAALCASAALLAGPALADDITVHGGHLSLVMSGSTDIRIADDSGLHGEVRITGDEASCLSHGDPGGDVALSDAGCGGGLDDVVITVPREMPLSLTIAGSGNLNIGDSLAPVEATIHGSGDFHAGDLGVLRLVVAGSGDATVRSVRESADVLLNSDGNVKIQSAAGALRGQINSSGDLGIARASLGATDIALNGSGNLAVGGGTVGVLRVRVNGSGDAIFGGSALTADLEAHGGGDIRVASVTGAVRRQATGGSSIVTNSTVAEGAGKLASFAMNLDDDDGSQRHRSSRGGEIFHHILAGGFLLFVAYLIWRMVQRRGGMAALRRAGRPVPGAPSHPGVLAIRENLARLDARLSRVEGYVTEREFELHRKFRDMEAGR